jgi:cell division septation protein DedD
VQVPPAGPPLQAKSQPTDSRVPEVSMPQVPKETLPAEAAPKVSKPSPPEADSAKPKAISYPYSVYLGSFRDQGRLQKAVSIFQGKGLSPYWCRFDLGEKGVWFRVFAGHFRTREEADRFIREKGTEEAASKETRYAALIGTYGSKEELDREVSRLKGLGFGPYVIQDGEAAARLYVGAFYQESHAAEQVKELASKGIESRVVPR